jgi:hypothetical protein
MVRAPLGSTVRPTDLRLKNVANWNVSSHGMFTQRRTQDEEAIY